VERGIIKINKEARPWDEIVIGGDVMQHILSTPAPSIGDRSWIDKCAYAQLLPYADEVKEAMHIYYSAAWFGQNDDDYYFLFPIGIIPLENDGVRSLDPEYQEAVDYWIQFYLSLFGVKYCILREKKVQDRYLEIKEVIKNNGPVDNTN
jgi:hypothetical protein